MQMRPFPMPTGRRRRAVAAVVAALLLAACGGSPDGGRGSSPTAGESSPDETSPARPSGETTPDPTASDDDDHVETMAFTDCEADRYTVRYPKEWNTNSGDGLLGPCTIFHPGDIDEPERARDLDLHYAVSMDVDEVDFKDRDPDDRPNEILEERETTVAGRDARVLEYRSTGEALLPEGESSYTWRIDLDGQTLVATTFTVGDTDYQRDKQILDRMVTGELTLPDETAMIDAPATTEQSSEEPDGEPLTVTDVDVGGHDGFDRIVFEIAGDGDAGWSIEYDDDPRSQGRGDRVDVEGDAILGVTLRDMAYPEDAPEEPYDGPERIEPDRTDAIVEVVEDVLYEGYHDFFVGLDAERPYRVARLSEPQRVVIDIETG